MKKIVTNDENEKCRTAYLALINIKEEDNCFS